MNKYLVIISFLMLVSCTKQDKSITGIWVKRTSAFPVIIEFTESQMIDNHYYGDSINYFIKNDSIFLQSFYNQEFVGYSYNISGDSLWTSFYDSFRTEENLYIKSKSRSFFNDTKSDLGIELNLPNGNSNVVGYRFGFSIYFPKQRSNDSCHYVYLNSERLKLDSLFHESVFNLLENNENIRYELVGLYIDSGIEYEDVRVLKNELRKVQFMKVAYISNPRSKENYAFNTGIIRKLPPIFADDNLYINPRIKSIIYSRFPPKPRKYYSGKDNDNQSHGCNIEILENQVLLNKKEFNLSDYYDIIRVNNPAIVYVRVDDETSYQNYYSFISMSDSLIKKKKDEISRGYYQQEYGQLIDAEKIRYVNELTKFGLIEE